MAGIAVSDIVKSFGGTRVLKGVSLSIEDGEFVSLVGPSGCGKSTLLRIIAGLEAQDGGSVSIRGKPVDGIRASNRDLAMVFQSYALYPHLTVEQNIAVPLRMRRLNSWQRLPVVGRMLAGGARYKSIREDVERAATQLDIAHLLKRKPGQLSGGQRQRVAVGRALVRDPVAFLLDEPLSNLDAKLRVHMRTEIAELHRSLGRTFVYVTHDQAEAMTMSDRIAVMMDGEIIQCAAPDEIYHSPADIRVAEFIGSPQINILPAGIGPYGALSLFGRALPLKAQNPCDEARIGIRPEALRITGGDGLVKAKITHLENLGAEYFVQLACDALDDRLLLRTDWATGHILEMGEELSLTFRPEDVRLFGPDGKAMSVRVVQEDKADKTLEMVDG